MRASSSERQRQGSVLAALQSEKQQKEVEQLLKQYRRAFWLGGTYDQETGKWTWANGAAWNFSYWMTDLGFPNSESTKNKLVIYTNGYVARWRNYKPVTNGWMKPSGCICQTRTTKMTKDNSIQKIYKKEDLKTQFIRLWWTYDYSKKMNLPQEMMTGMRFTWKLENKEFEESGNIFQVTSSPKTEAFRTTINILEGALEKNLTLTNIWNELKAFKARMTAQAGYCHRNPCSSGEMSAKYMKTTLKDFRNYLNQTASENVKQEMSEEIINEGFNMFHYLIFCPPNMHKAVQFSKHLIAETKIGPLVQASVDALLGDWPTLPKGFYTLLTQLGKLYDLDLTTLLIALTPAGSMQNTFAKDEHFRGERIVF